MNISTILEPVQQPILTEMAYPMGFDMGHLKRLPTFKDRILYCQKTLRPIGSGSSRIVFQVDKNIVLKVAKNEKGLGQNESESHPGLKNYSIVAKVFDADTHAIFVEMEYARGTHSQEIKEILGFDLLTLGKYLSNVHYSEKKFGPKFVLAPEVTEYMENSPWVKELVELAFKFDYILPGDFVAESSYGVITRNGKSEVVLVDYGFTVEVWADHYSRPTPAKKGDFDYVSKGA